MCGCTQVILDIYFCSLNNESQEEVCFPQQQLL